MEMAYDGSTLFDVEAVAAPEFRRDERFAVLIGGAAVGIALGFFAAMSMGRVGMWPLIVAAPVFALATYLAVATCRDAIERRAIGCAIAAGLVALSLLAWPAMGLIFPMSAPQFWIAPAATLGSMVLLASCWSDAQGAMYRLCGEAASLCAIVGFLGLNQIMG
jgi:ABC-type Na+ efflux pump permease subunit